MAEATLQLNLGEMMIRDIRIATTYPSSVDLEIDGISKSGQYEATITLKGLPESDAAFIYGAFKEGQIALAAGKMKGRHPLRTMIEVTREG